MPEQFEVGDLAMIQWTTHHRAPCRIVRVGLFRSLVAGKDEYAPQRGWARKVWKSMLRRPTPAELAEMERAKI